MLDRLIDLILGSAQAFQFLTVIDDYQEGVILRFGRYHRTVGPGLHWLWPFYVERVLTDNVVPTTKVLGTQSLTTADDVSVVLEVAVTYRTRDVKRLLLEVENAEAAMRDACYGSVAQEVLHAKWEELRDSAFNERLTKAARKKAFAYGIEIQAVQLADLSKAKSLRLWQA